MEGYGNYVDILGSRFPAVNIQIFDCYPELKSIPVDEASLWFGVYFEIMFETGYSVEVYQEEAREANGLAEKICLKDLDKGPHFIVEEYRPRMSVPCYDWHCAGEEELLRCLKNIKRGQSWIDGAPKEVFRRRIA